MITLNALMTYNDASVMNQGVVFTIYDAQKSVIAVRTARTDSNGLATAQFRLPWPNTAQPESVFGNWAVAASVNLSDALLNDTVQFTYNYIVTISTLQTPVIVHRSDNVVLNITLNSINNLPLTTTVTITVYDSQMVPIGTYTIPNVSQNPGNTLVTKTFNIPQWAFLGQATVYINVLTSTPDNGGLPCCPEATSKFSIQ
jgi:hypothetical protein